MDDMIIMALEIWCVCVREVCCYVSMTNLCFSLSLQNHIICRVPPYKDQDIKSPVIVNLEIKSAGKLSDPQSFTYLPSK